MSKNSNVIQERIKALTKKGQGVAKELEAIDSTMKDLTSKANEARATLFKISSQIEVLNELSAPTEEKKESKTKDK